MLPDQIRIMALLSIAIALCGTGAFTGGKTTRAAAAAMILCWLTVGLSELVFGSSFPVAFIDALYALALIGVGLKDRVMWPVYLVSGQAISLVAMFLLTDLTNSAPLAQIVGYNALVMSGPAFVFCRGIAERLAGRQGRDGRFAAL